MFHAGGRFLVLHLHLRAMALAPRWWERTTEGWTFRGGGDKPVAAVLNGGLHVVPIELPHLVRWLGEAGDDVDLVSQSDQEAPPFPPCFASL